MVGILPFIGAGIGNLVADRSTSVQIVATIIAWTIWATCAFSVSFLHPITLTAMRITTPVIAAGLLLVVSDTTQTQQIISAALSVAVLLLSF